MNLALKYRPSNFNDLIGQEVLVRILRNAFSLNKVPQSIILIGSSGVGKTTTARIIALALNCLSGPTPNPCGVCCNCTSIKNASHSDVIEIDAASNTGVDDIKVILENSYYIPINAKFKVYIIDEVHMLSNSAFNALLKTLEEPAPHVKFILATTEPRKIPSTVMSRCQRFDLRRISVSDIVKQLQNVAIQENIGYDQESLQLIASGAEGSMRNALFILEQAIAYGTEGKISAEIVKSMLGFVDYNMVADIFVAVVSCDLVKSLQIFTNAYEKNNPVFILESVLEFIHDLCVKVICNKGYEGIKDLFINKDEQYYKKALSPTFLSRLWQAMFKGIQEIKFATCIYTASEMLIVRLCCLSDLPSPQQIIKKIQSTDDDNINRLYFTKSNFTKEPVNKRLSEHKCENVHFIKVLDILKEHGQVTLYDKLSNDLNFIDCGEGFLMLSGKTDDKFSDDLSCFLSKVTNKKWFVTIQEEGGKSLLNDIKDNSLVQSVMKEFDGAKIVDVTRLKG